MRPIRLSAGRVYPLPVTEAFDATMPTPLPAVFRRRFALIPPIASTTPDEPWGTVGQQRTIRTTDGTRMLETLTEVVRPERFAYRLEVTRGPLTRLVDHIDGRWAFTPDPGGTRITWSWTLHPLGRVGAVTMPLFALCWRGYARRALTELGSSLSVRR